MLAAGVRFHFGRRTVSNAAAGDAAHPSPTARAGDLATMPLDGVLARLEVSPDKG
jgi:hypothetical protein